MHGEKTSLHSLTKNPVQRLWKSNKLAHTVQILDLKTRSKLLILSPTVKQTQTLSNPVTLSTWAQSRLWNLTLDVILLKVYSFQ